MSRKPTRTEKKNLKAAKSAQKAGIQPGPKKNKGKASKPTGKRDKPNTHSARGAQNAVGTQEQSTRGIAKLKKNSYFIFGRHAITAALKNNNRDCLRLVGLENTYKKADAILNIRGNLRADVVKDESSLREHVPADSPHQGMLLEVMPLPDRDVTEFADLEGPQLMLVLDQVTDPHNVGACLRAGAALGATALITQDRHCPLENGTIARTSAGGLEVMPWLRIGNMAATLEQLKEIGYWVVGMDGDTETNLRDVETGGKIALVMGSEGKGMRPLTHKHCDIIAKIPMTSAVESLNVSTAAAIAVYELGIV